MFIVALLIIARNQKQPRCPSTEELREKTCYIYTMNYIIQLQKWKKKKEIVKVVGKWMKLEKNHLGYGNTDSERQIWYVFTYMWILAVKSIDKQVTIHRTTEVR